MDSLTAEAEALEADEADRAEMLAVAEMMESLHAEVRKSIPIFSLLGQNLDGTK